MALTERLQILLESVGAGGVVRDFDKVGRASQGVGTDAKAGAKGLDRLGVSGLASSTALKAGVAAAATVAAGKLVNFGQAAIAAASALEEQVSGAGVTFGRFSGQIVDFADDSAAALGLARSEALAAANAFGTFFKLAGVSAESAAEGAESLVRLSADLASRFDTLGGVPAVLEKIRAGLAGETEPLRAVGVFLNETAVKAKAAELGLGGVGRQLTEGEKIAARYALIIEQTADAQGDLARTAGSLSNQQRRLRGEFEGLKEEVGGGLVPAGQIAVAWLRSVVSGAGEVRDAVGWLADGFGKMNRAMDDSEEISQDLRDRWGDVIGDAKTVAEAQEEITRNVMFGGEGEDKGAAVRAKIVKTLELQALAQQESATAAEDLTKATLATSSAQRSYDASVRAVTGAERTLTEARQGYNRLLKEGAVDEEKVADARQSLADASRSLASANRRLADVQEDYNEALNVANLLGTDNALEDLEDASDDLADAQDSVAGAAEREKDAQQDLAKAQAGDPEFNDKLAAAKRGVTEAEHGLADAQYNSAQRAYELDGALIEQNTLLATNANAILGVRNEWESLLARKPEIEAFLKGPMAPLSAGPGTGIGPGFGLRQHETPAPAVVPAASTAPAENQPKSVVFNNTTFNTPVDVNQLVRNIAWNIN